MATKTLSQYSKEIRSGMKFADTGPLVVASKVVQMVADWEKPTSTGKSLRDEAGGLAPQAWLTKELGNRGRNVSYWRRRAEAVQKLGPSIQNVLHHEVAVLVASKVDPGLWPAVVRELTKAKVKNNHNPLSLGQARPIIDEVVGHVPRPARCKRCEELEARVAELEGRLGASATI